MYILAVKDLELEVCGAVGEKAIQHTARKKARTMLRISFFKRRLTTGGRLKMFDGGWGGGGVGVPGPLLFRRGAPALENRVSL